MTSGTSTALSGADWFGFGLMVPMNLLTLWFFNRFVHSTDTLASLFMVWPRTHPREFGVWLGIAALLTGGVCLMLSTDTETARLARHHATTPGRFEQYEGNHAEFRYSFDVQHQRYHGYDSSDEHLLEDIQAGTPFVVYYDPENPNISTVSEPNRRASKQKITVLFYDVLLSGLLAILIRKLGALIRVSPSTHPPAAVAG